MDKESNTALGLLHELSAERRAAIDAIVSGAHPLEKWQRHTGVSTLSDLMQWAENQLRSVLFLRASRETDVGPPNDEMEDYLVGKQAVLSPLLSNIRQIIERSGADVTNG